MTRAALSLASLGALLVLSGCASPTVGLSIGFPSQESFLVTNLIDVQVVALDGDLDRCAALLGDAISGADVHPSSESLGLDACAVRSGVQLPDPGEGAHAFLVLGRATNGVILAGCSVGDVYPGGPAIEVDLYPTSTTDYAMAVTAAHPAPGSTADQRCGSSTP